MYFSTLNSAAKSFKILSQPIAAGSFCEDVLGYEINPARYNDCAICNVLEGFIP